MPTTTNYGWTTPADTDLVKDGASAIRTLGTAIDTTVFNNASAAIAKTIVDAKGDIIAATAADTVARLAVGSNDQVLTADSSTATGLKWAAPAAGGMTLISTTSLTGSSVTLSSIPSTYNNLQLVIRNYKPATDNTLLRLRINSDSGTRYKVLFTDNASNSGSTDSFNNSSISICGNNDNTDATGLSIVNIYDYNNAVSWKVLDFRSIAVDPTTTTEFKAANGVGFFNQTGAITSLDLFPTSGNFTSGSALLYGVK
jgi:hypothetical protein